MEFPNQTDEELGKALRETLLTANDPAQARSHSAGLILVLEAYLLNAEVATFDFNSCGYKGQPIGDWQITVKRNVKK